MQTVKIEKLVKIAFTEPNFDDGYAFVKSGIFAIVEGYSIDTIIYSETADAYKAFSLGIEVFEVSANCDVSVTFAKEIEV